MRVQVEVEPDPNEMDLDQEETDLEPESEDELPPLPPNTSTPRTRTRGHKRTRDAAPELPRRRGPSEPPARSARKGDAVMVATVVVLRLMKETSSTGRGGGAVDAQAGNHDDEGASEARPPEWKHRWGFHFHSSGHALA